MTKFSPIFAVLLVPAAVAFAAETASIDNLVVTIGSTTWRAPHIEVSGSSLPQVELSQLFSGDPATIDARLAKFSASRALIPSMTSETRGGSETERGAFNDSTLENIVAGRVALWRSAGGSSTVESKDGKSNYVWGPTTWKGADLRQMTRLALPVSGASGEPLKPVLDEEVIEHMRMVDETEKLEMTTNRLTLSGVKARPLSFTFAGFVEKIEKSDPAKSDPTLIKDILELLNAFEFAGLEARDLAIKGKGEPVGKPYSAKIARLGAEKVAGAGAGGVSVENFALTASDGGKLSFARLGAKDVQLTPFIKDDAWPTASHIEAKALEGDLPDPKTSEKSRMKFRLDNAVADFSNVVERMPTKVSAKIDHAFIDLAARGATESTAQLLALGYRELDVSASGAGEWREKNSDAAIGPIVIEGKNIGALRLSATLANVSRAAFSSMEIVSRAASLAISIRDLDLTLEGAELIDRVVALEAKETKKTVEQARADYAKTAGELVTAFAGGGEKAAKISAAVSAFVMKPKRLHLRLVAPKGVGALDALAKKPGELIEAMEVEAVAER